MKLPSAVTKTRQELLPPYPSFAKDGKGDLVVPKGYEDHFFTLPGSPAPFQAGQRDRLFRNDGYARWVDVTDEAGIKDQGNGLSVVWWDFDADGRQDLYVANDFQSPDHLYHNLGNACFRSGAYGLAILYYRRAQKLEPEAALAESLERNLDAARRTLQARYRTSSNTSMVYADPSGVIYQVTHLMGETPTAIVLPDR